MTKKTWAALAAVFFIISFASGVYLYVSVSKNAANVPLRQTATPQTTSQKPAKPTADTSSLDISTTTVKTEKKSPSPDADSIVNSKHEARNIGFSYHNKKAKAVSIIGDFNNGTKESMAWNGKNWSTHLKLKPGTYQYQFIVDGKKIRDPNNKKISNEGKSILVVKPLAT